jgi:transcriptional regulator with PAS, ATPase and Fis domain
MAAGGTIFLGEIGDLSLNTQTDLLRVIEEKKFFRVGGNKEIYSDFRTIAATNKDLEQMVANGTFRSDLYYRLNVFTIFIPPLKDRPEDIPVLIEHFIKKYAMSMNKPIRGIDPSAMSMLLTYDWPGNVRELENAIERAMVVAKSEVLHSENFAFRFEAQKDDEKHARPLGTLSDMEKEYIQNVLEETGWNIAQSARLLDIDRVTLYNKIKKYNLTRKA